MLSVDHLNIDGVPFLVKCVRKFGSALDGEVTLGVCMCARRDLYACIYSSFVISTVYSYFETLPKTHDGILVCSCFSLSSAHRLKLRNKYLSLK